jgi:hypothetical protein
MIESPLIKEIVEKTACQKARQLVEAAIRKRFRPLSDSARASLEGLEDEAKLDALHDFAVDCSSLEAFLERLAKETTPAEVPVSSRRSRKR